MTVCPTQSLERAFTLAEIANRAANEVNSQTCPAKKSAAQDRYKEAAKALVEEMTKFQGTGAPAEVFDLLNVTYAGAK